MLALPVLAGSSAYALGETFGWHVGLARRPARAKAFYTTITIASFVGIGLNFTPLDPSRALFWSAVIYGIVAVPVMVVMMLMSRSRSVMGDFVIPPVLGAFGWAATGVMFAAAAGMFATLGG